jgi:protoporphyrinogen oxidase
LQYSPTQVVIAGAGPAGLTAAYELVQAGLRPIVFEKSDKVGGIARTETYKGYRFDIGGHRFFTKVDEVQNLWTKVLREEFLSVPRLSRIVYQGKFYKYPLDIFGTLRNLGVTESSRIILSYIKWRVKPYPDPDSLEQWVINRFGGRLYMRFFKTYTEKVWGMPCNKIQADWAAQRIQGLSLSSALMNAVFKRGDVKSLISEFQYPSLGPGMMWDAFRTSVEEGGGSVEMQRDMTKITRSGNRIVSVTIHSEAGEQVVPTDNLISSMPITELIQKLDPPAPDYVRAAADNLSYRDFLIVCLIVDKPSLFPDNWIYVHTPGVKVGRIQNFKNWSAAMLPDQTKTSLGMEYFCSTGDDIWEMDDADLVRLATKDMATLGLASEGDVEDGTVVRQLKAYPVYDGTYKANLAVLREYIESFENLQTIGRNGMHRYNNQDHSMLTGIYAARNVLGASYDLWEVNTERSYHEDFTRETSSTAKPGGGRPVAGGEPLAAATGASGTA